MRARIVKKNFYIACRYFKRSLSNVQTPVVIISNSEPRVKRLKRMIKGKSFRICILVVIVSVIGFLQSRGRISPLKSILPYSRAVHVGTPPLPKSFRNDAPGIAEQHKDLENWRNSALEHWKIYKKPENLLKIKKPIYDKRFKNPCWYEKSKKTKMLRCVPFFFLAGVKKCGTTTLFRAIRAHPDIVVNTAKETQWFPRGRFGIKKRQNPDNGSLLDTSFSGFVDMFDKSAKIIEQHMWKSPSKFSPKITGEGTPGNLHVNSHWRYLPENAGLPEPKYVILDYIHRLIPQAKIIIIFRDPIDRLYSDYYHEYRWFWKENNPSAEHFHQVISEGIILYKNCFKYFTLRSCVYNETIYEHTAINIQLGIYHVYWEDVLRVFPRDQVFYVHTEDMKKNLKQTVLKIYRFLDLRTLNVQELAAIEKLSESFVNKYNNTREPILPETKELLQDFYRPFNKKMVSLTNDPQFLYT